MDQQFYQNKDLKVQCIKNFGLFPSQGKELPNLKIQSLDKLWKGKGRG